MSACFSSSTGGNGFTIQLEVEQKQLPKDPDRMTLPKGMGWASQSLLPGFLLWIHHREGRARMKKPPWRKRLLQREAGPVHLAGGQSQSLQRRRIPGWRNRGLDVVQELPQPQGGCGRARDPGVPATPHQGSRSVFLSLSF